MSALHIAATEKRLFQALETLEEERAENAKLTTRLKGIEAALKKAKSVFNAGRTYGDLRLSEKYIDAALNESESE